MTWKNEGAWKAALRRALSEIGAVALSVHGGAMQASGWPDVYFVKKGTHVWVELKMCDGKLSMLQRSVIRRLRAAGAVAFVLRLNEEQTVASFEDEDGGFLGFAIRPLDVATLFAVSRDSLQKNARP